MCTLVWGNGRSLRIVVGAVVILTATSPTRATAQPGYGPPVLLEDAQALDAVVAREGPRVSDGRLSASTRLAAAVAVATAYGELWQKVSLDPERIDPGVEPLVRTRFGVGLDGLATLRDDAWTACRAVIVETHALDNRARACLLRPTRYVFPRRALLFALPPSAAFGRATTADESARAARTLLGRQRAHPSDRTLRREALGILARTGDADEALAALGPLAREYDAEVTVGLALHRARRPHDALARFASAALSAPDRPEAWYALAVILDEEIFDPGPPLATIYRTRFAFARAFLCTRAAARLAEPPDAWAHAAQIADSSQWQGYGGSHTAWRSTEKRPLPFVIAALMPPNARDDRRRAGRTCPDGLRVAEALARTLAQQGVTALAPPSHP